MFWIVFVAIAQFFAVALANVIARGWFRIRPNLSYRPVAYFLTYVFAIEYVRWALLPVLLSHKPPYLGFLKIVACFYESLYWGWMFGATALAVRLYLHRSIKPVVIVYAAAVLGLFVFYPDPLTGSVINWIRQGLHAAEALFVLVAFGVWVWRKPADLTISIERQSPFLIGGIDSIVVFGPYVAKNYDTSRWDLARVAYAALYLGLVLLQGGYLWRSSQSRAQQSRSSLLH